MRPPFASIYCKNIVFFTDLDAFAAIIKRETDKETRHKQNEFIKELDPLVFTLHLGKNYHTRSPFHD